ncbi:uncharacterized protein LOC135487688 [Lineus longissimus]|uniref:uncharacterized protein LOC135487688 n=1 Tax=Lineus longissimus TaxID=88925 RepID=UPI00315C4F54
MERLILCEGFLLIALWLIQPCHGFYEVKPHIFTTRSGFVYFTCPEHYCGAGGSCRPKTNIVEYIPCYCDIYCELLHDCCLEHMQECTHGIGMVLLLANDILHYKDYYGCAEVGYTSVTKCPESVSGYVKSACEDEQPCDIYKRIPVVGNGVVFRNLYCAQCHDLGLSNITTWKVQISKQSIQDVRLSTVFRILFSNTNQGHNIRGGLCTDFKAVPAEPTTYFLRECSYNTYKYNHLDKVNQSEIISTCDPHLRNSLKDYSVLDNECMLYNANVYARIPHMTGTVRFKNMFCAKCNGIKEWDLFCPPPIRVHHPPKLIHDFSPDIGSDLFIPLDSLMNLRQVRRCNPGELFDENTKICVFLRRCDLGHVEWEGKCVRDPFDEAYSPPILGSGEGSLHLNITIHPKFTIVLSDDDLEEKDIWGSSLLPAIIENLYLENFEYFVKDIKEINVTLDSNLSDEVVGLLDGKEIQFGPNTTFTAYMSHYKMSLIEVQKLVHHIQFFNERKHQVKVGYRVFSRDVIFPLQCEEGEVVYIRNTTESRRYLNTMRSGFDFKNLTWFMNETDMYVVVCDKYARRFSNCRLTNHSLDKFDVISGELRFKASGNRLKENVIFGNFVFGCFEEGKIGVSLARTVITVAGLSLSLLCLAFTLLTYCVFANLRTLPGLLLMNLCTTLALSQLLSLIAIDKTSNPNACEIIAIIIHFFWLSTFFWMNAIAFNMMWTFTAKLTPIREHPNYKALVLYTLYAYGVPACVVVISILLEHRELLAIGYRPIPAYTKLYCWLSEGDGVLYAFIIPVGLLTTSNIILFTITSLSIFWTRKIAQQAKRDPKNRRQFMIYIRLSSLMGSTWIIVFVGVFYGHVAIWCLLDLFNSLTGVYIGLAFALTKDVLTMWRPTGSASTSHNKRGTSSERLSTATYEKRISLAISTSTPLTLMVDGHLLKQL